MRETKLGVIAGFYSNSAINALINLKLIGSSGINGTQIFACYCDRVLGHWYLLWLKIFTATVGRSCHLIQLIL